MKNLPKKIPVFPLSNFIIFPKTTVPLNIFEKRYIDMVNDSMKSNKLIGMIQPKATKDINEFNPKLYEIGCLGKISDLQKIKDGRVLINLTGISRFKILKEISNTKLYREFQVDYKNFIDDTNINEIEVDAKNLLKKIKIFFQKNELHLNWREFEKLDKSQQINTLAMIAPITNEEKQKLLESISLEKKVNVLENIITFYLHNSNLNNFTLQ